jgi:hypothetical protein
MVYLSLDIHSCGIPEFLRQHPPMSLRPQEDAGSVVEGLFAFSAPTKSHGSVTDAYQLRIVIPPSFPRDIPSVYETGGRIPRTADYHVNSDGSFCLGSRLRLLQRISADPTLIGFARTCVVPYLFAVATKLTHGGDFIFGELAHGPKGELADYADLMGLDSPEKVILALRYLGIKKRRANKLPCPCGCGIRLGHCRFNRRLRNLRLVADRQFFRSLLQYMNTA